MSWLTLALVLSAFQTVDVAARRDDEDGPVVETEYGKVQGFRYSVQELEGVSGSAYLGIPFAEPPVGSRRFRRPEPLRRPWTGIRNANRLPSSCYQEPDVFFGEEFPGSTMWNPNTELSEDCLMLNVWVPDDPRSRNTRRPKNDAKKPVMVWIFGGGFYSGTTTLDVYDGRILAAEYDVIVVSVGYRVGALGFFCLDHPSAPGNMGLFDQLMGLQWVQRNIGAFGGDANNVTLFGESAGSASVSLHLLSPLSRDLFHRAILQSGSANMPWATTSMAEGKLRSEELAIAYLLCPRTKDMQELSDCMRQIEPSRIASEQWVSRGILQFPFLPVVDREFLPERPDLMLEHRSFKRCPILIGSNKNEGSWFVVYELSDRLTEVPIGSSRVALEVPPGDRQMMPLEQYQVALNTLFFYYPQYRQELNSSFGMDAISFQYTSWAGTSLDDSASNLAGLDAALGDSNFVCPLNRFAAAFADAGVPVYMYFFTEAYSSNPWPSWMGVMHGDDIIFMFGHVLRDSSVRTGRWPIAYTPGEKELSRRMMTYWTNFAKSGDPNSASSSSSPSSPPASSVSSTAGVGSVPWPLHTASGHEYLELNSRLLYETDPAKVIGQTLRAKQCAFWSDYLPKLVVSTAHISEREKAWKLEFTEWTTRYIVDWKTQYELYVNRQQQGDRCPPPR